MLHQTRINWEKGRNMVDILINIFWCFTYLYARPHKLRDLFAHERVEMWVETVDGAVDADGDAGLVHLVEQAGDAGRHQVGCAPGHALTHVAHCRHVCLGCV